VARETKTEREKRQVECFLRNLLAFDDVESMENNDPPDVRIWKGGRVILNLELTEYHVDPEEVAANSKWNVRLLPKIDELRKQDASLTDIYALVAFNGGKVPRLSKADNDSLAAELVRLAGEIGSTLAGSESLKISFLTRSFCLSHPIISPGWHRFPSEDWPLCARNIGSVAFSRLSHGWHRWVCPHADMGWTRQTSDKFLGIFTDKETKVRRALHDVARFMPGVPTWLLIVSDVRNDMTSHLFPTNQEDREELFQLIDACNYDWSNSLFAEVWLYAEFGQSKLRIFPRS
jgi:hypothetical protein